METLNLIFNFILNNLSIILAVIYGIIAIIYQWRFYKARNQNIKYQTMLNDTLKITEVLLQTNIKTLKSNNKLKSTLKIIREKRNSAYKKHATQITYFKKRVIAYKVAIKTTFKEAPQFIILLQEEFYDISKKSLTQIRKIEKSLDKKD